MPKDTKKCIKDFIRQVELLEIEEDPDGNGFDKEYRRINEVQMQRRKDNVFTMDIGKTESNLKKNRYKDILPYDEHRVVLCSIEGEEDSDYINASRLMGVKGTGGYIATQGPLASTVNDFWRMIWEYNVEIIFMACRIVELGKIKCKQYWNDLDKSDTFGDITVYTEDEQEIASDFIQRRLRVTKGEEQRMVIQFHYSGWPDHGIPDDPAHIRDLIGIMRRTRQNDEVPLLIHCSAGCGRTGAIAAIDYVWTLLEEGRFDEGFNLYELICTFREQRMSIVQTAEQYALVNQVLKSLCQEWLTRMASHTYENVEVDQDSANNFSEQDYENEEHVYEDSRSLNRENSLESNPALTMENGNPGPEVVSLHAVVPAKHENQSFIDRVPSQKAPAPPPPAGAESKAAPVHSTIIQIGSPKHAAPGGDSQISYKVLSKGLTSDSIKTVDKHIAEVYGTANKPPVSSVKAESFNLPNKPPLGKPNQVMNATINKQLPIKPNQDAYATVNKQLPIKPNQDAYATVNKQLPVKPMQDATVNKQPPVKPNQDVYATVNKQLPVKPMQDVYATINKQPPVKPIQDAYATVNKQLPLKPMQDAYATINKQLPVKPTQDAYATINKQPFEGAYSTVDSPTQRLSLSSPDAAYDFVFVGNIQKPQNLSASPPGCQVRLPRVRGPVPFPHSWKDS